MSLCNVVYNKLMELDNGGKVQAEYVWIGGSGQVSESHRSS